MNSSASASFFRIPSFIITLVAYTIGMFALTMNGTVIDPSTKEGKGVIILAVVGAIFKFLQASPSVNPAK
jgi:ABC-type xylose transport system permease subunit